MFRKAVFSHTSTLDFLTSKLLLFGHVISSIFQRQHFFGDQHAILVNFLKRAESDPKSKVFAVHCHIGSNFSTTGRLKWGSL